jgi:hypothetical protein
MSNAGTPDENSDSHAFSSRPMPDGISDCHAFSREDDASMASVIFVIFTPDSGLRIAVAARRERGA